MTLAELADRWPRAHEAHRLRALGHDMRDIGAIMGISRHTACTQVNRAKQALSGVAAAKVARAANPDLVPAHVTRCKCGLVLPCHNCIPEIWHYASSRHGESAGMF